MELVMLAHVYSKKRIERWNSDTAIIQPKINGLRCLAVKQANGKFRLFSRKGNEFTQLPLITEALGALEGFPGQLQFDGELYVHGMPLQEIRAICKRTTTRHPNHGDMEYHIFDKPPVDYTECLQPQTDRLSALYGLLSIFQKETRIRLVSSYTQPLEVIDALLQDHLRMGYEGIILRNPAAFYEFRRSNNLLKLKPRMTGAYTIIAANEAIDIYGYPKNTLGSLTLLTKEGKIFNCGAGVLSHPQRDILWERREMLKEKVAHIYFQELSTAGIPQQPILRSIDEVDYDC